MGRNPHFDAIILTKGMLLFGKVATADTAITSNAGWIILLMSSSSLVNDLFLTVANLTSALLLRQVTQGI